MRQTADFADEMPLLVVAKTQELALRCAPVTVAEAFRVALDALIRGSGRRPVDLTRSTGLSSATLTRLLNGERGASFEVLEKIRVGLGVTAAALFDPDAALSKLGLRRETDTTGQPVDTQGAHVVSSASPAVGLEGGPAVQHPDSELLLALLAYWDAMAPDARLELVGHGRRLRAATIPADFRRA